MILRFDSRLALAAVFAASQLFASCARKETKKGHSAEPTSDADSGEEAPPPAEGEGDDGGGDGFDAPGNPKGKGGDKTPGPLPDDSGDDSPYGQKLEPNVASIQAKLLDVYCVGCHRGENPKAGLDLTSLAAHLDGTVRGSYEGRLVVPGAPEVSMLALVIDPAVAHSADLPLMPPPPAEIPAVSAEQAEAVKAFIKALPGDGVTDLDDGAGSDGGEGDDDGGRGDALDPDIDL